MYKNWPEICKIKNDLFRLVVATTKDEYVLAGLEKGFPELFIGEEIPLRVPASALREAAREYSRRERYEGDHLGFDTELGWLNVLDDFDIPLAYGWSAEDGSVLNDLLEQMVGQKLEMGLSVEYRGVKCLVVHISDYAGKLHEVIAEMPETNFLYLIPADCVDLNA